MARTLLCIGALALFLVCSLAVDMSEVESIAGKVKECMKLKTRDDCDDVSGCTWCTDSKAGALSGCFPASAAKVLPGFLTCDADVAFSKPKPKPATPCTDFKTKEKCDDDISCAWCDSKMVPGPGMGSCYDAKSAKWLPPQVFDCDLPDLTNLFLKQATKPAPAPKCKDFTTELECEDDDTCAWCEPKMKGAKPGCHDAKAAAWLPPQVYDCKMPEL